MGRAHMNPIFNTRMYQVEFTGGKVTELTPNVIAKSMYIQCDADGNEYILLDVLVDYCKEQFPLRTNRSVCMADQNLQDHCFLE